MTLLGQATSLFQEQFGSRPALAVSAPGRINLLGEHTDYNGGPVLPLAIERRTVVVAAPALGWEAVSTRDGVVDRFDPTTLEPAAWTGYLVGAVRVLERAGLAPRGARLAVASAVPTGAGLSSSAALTVATVRALLGLGGHRIPPERIADLAWQSEHHEVGVRCGRMDQTVVALARAGHALHFETGRGALEHLPLPGRVWVFETGVSHQLAGGAYNVRRQECEAALRLAREAGVVVAELAEIPLESLPRLDRALPAPWSHRLRHVVSETHRTRSAADALRGRDLPLLGRLLTEGHASLRDEFQSSCAEADLLVESVVRHGAHGARLTGAGWGGAVIGLVPAEREARVAAEVQEDFRQTFGRLPVVWHSRAAAGLRHERIAVGGGSAAEDGDAGR